MLQVWSMICRQLQWFAFGILIQNEKNMCYRLNHEVKQFIKEITVTLCVSLKKKSLY